MFGLQVLDAADIFIFPGQLPQPGTPGNIIAGRWADPDVIYLMTFTEGYDINPCQNICALILFPEPDILFSGACISSAREIQAAIPALFALKVCWGHIVLPCQVFNEFSLHSYPRSIPANRR